MKTQADTDSEEDLPAQDNKWTHKDQMNEEIAAKHSQENN